MSNYRAVFVAITALGMTACSGKTRQTPTRPPPAPVSSPGKPAPAPTAKPVVPPWEEVAARYKPTIATKQELFLDMARHACARGVACSAELDDVYACIDQVLPDLCRQEDCSQAAGAIRLSPAWQACMNAVVSLPCEHDPGDKVQCSVPQEHLHQENPGTDGSPDGAPK